MSIRQLLSMSSSFGFSTQQLNRTAIPDAVRGRLSFLGLEWDSLDGIAQRALLWDTGFGVSAAGTAVQIFTDAKHSTITKDEFMDVGCVAMNCSQPDGTLGYTNLYCTGDQMLTLTRCLAENHTDDFAYHSMWSTGGFAGMLPSPRLAKHTWMDGYTNAPNQGQSGLWNDDIITANRISREKVRPLQLISRGAFGVVYAGIFNDEQVAVKMLLPSTRRDIKLVNEFLSEARLTACMEHPRIATFIGIAWVALSNLCVVMEFMDGGDLRTLLSNYEKARHPVGFNREKATIALHVAHALTYLHSLEPPVIHRDLKSRNILLNQMHEAKLTDFGISRERLDRAMTAGVGTSLWMAPEVMTGEKYDDKADMFSFGVVLSELDAHTLPYTQTQQEMQHSHGRQMTGATLLQRVAMGTVSVTFSSGGPQSMVELGIACVSVDPTKRPSAAEALFKLQVILARELA
ncbi:unnamed protein product [Phytophthora lilii]|uniref:Unnamed protein product n=1 Tax=Phytophthora lilii TaxID=2077276 RepID=A0A9W6U8S6_9STRA|nr:unnamed protein product [Phytophthora lilii]